MYKAVLYHAVDEPWIAMEPINVGKVPSGAGTPGIFVTVERDGTPIARIDAWPLSAGPFTEIVTWRRFVVIGWNDAAHLVDPLTREVRSIECDGYFGHLYPSEDHLLIADASRLTCIDANGRSLWISNTLGMDGVIVDDVQGGVVSGQGEWDPPGGWKPFRLSLVSGQAAAK